MSTRSRISALTIVAAVAATTAAGVGAASAPAHADSPKKAGKASTSISIRVQRPRIEAGKKDVVTGDLHVGGKATAEGRYVTLEARADGESAFTPVGVSTAGKHGGLKVTVAPEVTTKYRWHYFGATDAKARLSAVATVRIKTGDATHHPKRLPTTLSIRAAHKLVGADGSDTVKGRLRSSHTDLPHRWVVLVSHAAGQDGWRYVGAHRTTKDGVVVFGVKPKADTAYRLQFPGTQAFRPSHSGVAHIGVRPDLTISATPETVDPGQSSVISTVVTDGGQPVAGSTVVLFGRTAKPHTTSHKLGTSTTADDGAAAFTVTPTKDTRYRVVLKASKGVPTSTSPAVTVSLRHSSSLSIRGKDGADGFTVSGTLRGGGHAIPGASVSLMAEAPGTTTFTEVASAETGKAGGVRFTEPTAAGRTYRLDFAGDEGFSASSSGTVVD